MAESEAKGKEEVEENRARKKLVLQGGMVGRRIRFHPKAVQR